MGQKNLKKSGFLEKPDFSTKATGIYNDQVPILSLGDFQAVPLLRRQPNPLIRLIF